MSLGQRVAKLGGGSRGVQGWHAGTGMCEALKVQYTRDEEAATCIQCTTGDWKRVECT